MDAIKGDKLLQSGWVSDHHPK